jgi:hypothetical protein
LIDMLGERIEGTKAAEGVDQGIGKGRIEGHSPKEMGAPGCRAMAVRSATLRREDGASGLKRASVGRQSPMGLMAPRLGHGRQDAGLMQAAHQGRVVGGWADLTGRQGTARVV